MRTKERQVKYFQFCCEKQKLRKCHSSNVKVDINIEYLDYRGMPIRMMPQQCKILGISVHDHLVNRWVHTSLVSRPQVYFNLTSDMNGPNFNLSSLLCSHGNVSCSKEPKYTSKSSSTHPYQRTYALSKQFQEIECQSNALFDEISEHARLVRHAHHFRTTCLFDAWLS